MWFFGTATWHENGYLSLCFIFLCYRNIDGVFTTMVDNASSNNTVIIYLKGTIKKWKGTILGHEFLHMR